MPSADCFAFAETDGLFETAVDLGEPVAAGEPLAHIHPIARTGREPQVIRAGMSGILAARHFPGLVQAGDCAAVIAVLMS
jgi:N-alpha-acetyl-L-2,4-diaminobutyrate deacetylase